MTDVPHFGFILAAYGVAALVLAVTIAVLVIDQRRQKRLLDRFDPRAKERA